MRLKKWLAAANTTLCAGKCFPWTTRVTSQRVPWGECAQWQPNPPHTSCRLVSSHWHTCFLRLFITPMMLDSCLYSSLVAHFLSLFFLEHDAFSAGETTPVMLSGLFQSVPLNWSTVSGVQLRAPLLLYQASLAGMTGLLWYIKIKATRLTKTRVGKLLLLTHTKFTIECWKI